MLQELLAVSLELEAAAEVVEEVVADVGAVAVVAAVDADAGVVAVAAAQYFA